MSDKLVDIWGVNNPHGITMREYDTASSLSQYCQNRKIRDPLFDSESYLIEELRILVGSERASYVSDFFRRVQDGHNSCPGQKRPRTDSITTQESVDDEMEYHCNKRASGTEAHSPPRKGLSYVPMPPLVRSQSSATECFVDVSSQECLFVKQLVTYTTARRRIEPTFNRKAFMFEQLKLQYGATRAKNIVLQMQHIASQQRERVAMERSFGYIPPPVSSSSPAPYPLLSSSSLVAAEANMQCGRAEKKWVFV